ncbi:hypothetical protein ACFPOI_33515 [Nonomuraea angiospora]|uniref:Uncharacterized protein n=1 Tax=Nonomuraea angiospora TaxID=46172 RepID=A0ABR9LSY1_9ACTN|nr:hypothetical protein [Nonomuraea angiospora]MBE1583757.1 hypothetical protein [Nonomuraea angiospora]
MSFRIADHAHLAGRVGVGVGEGGQIVHELRLGCQAAGRHMRNGTKAEPPYDTCGVHSQYGALTGEKRHIDARSRRNKSGRVLQRGGVFSGHLQREVFQQVNTMLADSEFAIGLHRPHLSDKPGLWDGARSKGRTAGPMSRRDSVSQSGRSPAIGSCDYFRLAAQENFRLVLVSPAMTAV